MNTTKEAAKQIGVSRHDKAQELRDVETHEAVTVLPEKLTAKQINEGARKLWRQQQE